MLRELYNQFISEHFDIMDTDTRKCLLTINEADQNQVLGSLAAKLYDSIVKKVTDIDFGQIPLSKGDITKIPNYMDITECLSVIRDMCANQRQSTTSVDTILTSIENMKKYKNIWEKGYTLDCELVIVFYNTIALSIVSSTSILIAATVEFVKNPESQVIDLELAKIANNKSKDGILFKNLEKFNKACKKGDITKVFDSVLKAQRTVRESDTYIKENVFSVLYVGAIVIGLLSTVIPLLHQLTTALYNLRQNVAEYLSGEADIIRLNAEKVQYNRAKTPEQKKKIIAKQHKIADHFKKWANAIMVKNNNAERETEKQLDKDKKEKYKIGDVVDEIPDSASIF